MPLYLPSSCSFGPTPIATVRPGPTLPAFAWKKSVAAIDNPGTTQPKIERGHSTAYRLVTGTSLAVQWLTDSESCHLKRSRNAPWDDGCSQIVQRIVAESVSIFAHFHQTYPKRRGLAHSADEMSDILIRLLPTRTMRPKSGPAGRRFHRGRPSWHEKELPRDELLRKAAEGGDSRSE